MKKVILVLIILSILLGSNNYQELNNLSIITNIGIEQNKDNYKVIFQEIIPIKENNKIRNKLKYYEVSGQSIEECIVKIKENIPKSIYFEHLENIVIKSNDFKVVKSLKKVIPDDLDNFNIVYTESDLKNVLKYGNSFNYINSIVNKKLKYRTIKTDMLEHKKIKVPIIKFKDSILVFYKYKVMEV